MLASSVAVIFLEPSTFLTWRLGGMYAPVVTQKGENDKHI